jgi:predicted thioesterase
MALAPGLKHTQSWTVSQDMTPPHLRGDAIRVLATPDMVRLVEQTAIQCAQPHLADGQTTVGTVVNIKHLAATPEGMNVTVTVEITEVDRRRLAYKFEVHDEIDKVGEGTHERFVIDGASRLPKLQQKVDAWKAKRT